MKRLTQIIPLFLLLVFGAILFNYLFFVNFAKSKKRDMRQELLKTSLHFFEKKEIAADDLYKNKNGLEWHEQNKEVAINGEFYEVIKVEKKNNRAVLYIIKDKKENELFNAFFSADKKKNDLLCSLVKLLFNLQSTELVQPDLSQQITTISQKRFFGGIYFKSQYYFKIIKPPQASSQA